MDSDEEKLNAMVDTIREVRARNFDSLKRQFDEKGREWLMQQASVLKNDPPVFIDDYNRRIMLEMIFAIDTGMSRDDFLKSDLAQYRLPTD